MNFDITSFNSETSLLVLNPIFGKQKYRGSLSTVTTGVAGTNLRSKNLFTMLSNNAPGNKYYIAFICSHTQTNLLSCDINIEYAKQHVGRISTHDIQLFLIMYAIIRHSCLSNYLVNELR